MKYIPQSGDIIKCTNTRDLFEHAGSRKLGLISKVSKGDKFKVLMAFQTDLTGNNYNVTVMPLYELHDKHKGLRLNLCYRVDTQEFSYYHTSTLYAVLKKEEAPVAPFT